MRIEDLQKKAAALRLKTLMAICKAGKGSSGSCMSVMDILVALYYGEIYGRRVMNFDVGKPGWDAQDYVVFSKGHAAAALYSVLADLGFFDEAELDYLGKHGALLAERPHNKIPGVTASVLGYGQGLSVAVGLALALQMDRASNKVFAVLGDGELQSGQVWEAAMAAAHYKLNNLVAVIDNNKVQLDGLVNSVMDVGSIQDKFEAFGWEVIQVRDGHDFDRLLDGLAKSEKTVRKPVCLWCNTVASKGIDFAERKASYQAAVLSEGELAEVISNFKEVYGLEIG